MLRQKLSPLQAFDKADVNKTGSIPVNSFYHSLKDLLPPETFTAADLKMAMLTFDKNKNGLIEQEEFIQAFEAARGSGLGQTNNSLGFTRRLEDSDEETAAFNDRASVGKKAGSRPASGPSPGSSVSNNLLKMLLWDLIHLPSAPLDNESD